jgi:hypothetical protein
MPELQVYLAVLVVLLVVRLPLVKQRLARLRPQRQVERPIIPLPLPARIPEPRPQIYEYEDNVSCDPSHLKQGIADELELAVHQKSQRLGQDTLLRQG